MNLNKRWEVNYRKVKKLFREGLQSRIHKPDLLTCEFINSRDNKFVRAVPKLLTVDT